MKVTEALEDIAYIKSLCKEARENLYSWRPFFLVFATLWMIGIVVPTIPGVPSSFSLDGKHWPLLFLIGVIVTWIIKRKTKLQRVPFMMRLLIWNWALLFVFAVASLFWSTGGYSSVHMHNYWLMVIGIAFLMTGINLQTHIGWIGVGFFGMALVPTDLILKTIYFFPPARSAILSVEAPVFIFKAIICGLLLAITWLLISRPKAGAVVE